MKILFCLALCLLLYCSGVAFAHEGVNATADVAMGSNDGQAELEDAYTDDLFDEGGLYADDDATDVVNDPLETLNRGIFWFNDKCYFYLFKPVAKGWRVLPHPVRNCFRNVFSNLRTPLNAVNDLLQLKFERAATEVARLLVNTTLGLAGIFDPAKKYCALEGKEEDFGQTLGYYGVGEGFYVVLPLLGASTLRDSISLVPDGYADPLYWLANYETTLVGKGVKNINALSLDKDTYESIKEEQLDPYLFVRDAYIQNRRFKVSE